MKYVKMISLVAVAAMALMAVAASSASATALYNGTTKLGVGAVLDFSLEPGTTAKLTNTSGSETLDECKISTVKGSITNAGSATTTVSGPIEALTWEECTAPTVTDTKGSLEIHSIAGTTNGTLTAKSEIGVTINTFFFGICQYGVKAGADLGTLTGSKNPATFDANAIAVKLAGSNFACPETTRWTGSYIATAPNTELHTEES